MRHKLRLLLRVDLRPAIRQGKAVWIVNHQGIDSVIELRVDPHYTMKTTRSGGLV